MIASLAGILAVKHTQSVIVEVQGVGYAVSVNLGTVSRLGQVGDRVFLITYLDVKEDSLSLYGFLEQSEYELFRLLISVSGVGCRSALTILDLGDPGFIASAIANSDVVVLTKVSGIGKKTAERIILELRDKVGVMVQSSNSQRIFGSSPEDDLAEALSSLGYKPAQIQKITTQIDHSLDLSDQVRQALKLLQS